MDDFAELKGLADRLYADDGTKKPEHYLQIYASILRPLRRLEFDLLEIGVFSGASLLSAREFFPKANIVGLDIRAMPERIAAHVSNGSLSFIQGDQSSPASLDQCLAKTASGKFDVIIDDASHVGWLSRASFDHLFLKGLKAGGLYFIEDYGTGYSSSFSDGRDYVRAGYKPEDRDFPSHHAGMVGWVKQLIDELHLPAVHPKAPNQYGIASIQFWPSIALVQKTGEHPVIPGR